MPKHTKHDFTNAKAVKIDSIEGEYARVTLPDDATENWSLSGLPRGVSKGDRVYDRAAEGQFEMTVTSEENCSKAC